MDELTRLAVHSRSGNPVIMAAFIRATQREVWSLCAYLVDAAIADDLTQETYLRVFRALPRFRRESSARTWLLAITRRVCMDELRARTKRRRHEILTEDASAHALAAVAECPADETGELRALIRGLPHEPRAAFVLTQVLGLSYAEASTVCGCAPGTIGSRVARARDELISAINAHSSGKWKETRRDALD